MTWWLVRRYLKTQRGLLNLSTALSVIGMMIGVGSLVVAMAVVSGFETTLKKSVIDTFGHLVVLVRGGADQSKEFIELKSNLKTAEAYTPFLMVESILAYKGKTSGVFLYGVDESTVHQVVHIRPRIVAGEFSLELKGGLPGALIGKGIARRHHIRVGDRIRLVLPQSTGVGGSLRTRVEEFHVSGIINLGRHDFDSRYVMASLPRVQKFSQLENKISGYRFRITNPEEADSVAQDIENQFSDRYEVSTWRDVNRYLFEAVRLEKPVIFFVLLIIVIAASFNIATTLFVNVIRRYRDISVLKSMGAERSTLLALFSLQGTLIGAIGAAAGLILGLAACIAFVWLQNKFGLISGEVYKLDQVDVELRVLDIVGIILASLLISFLASLGPAWRGASLPPVEGLRYE